MSPQLTACSETNSVMRRIDLGCKTAAPFFAAIIIQFSDWAGSYVAICPANAHACSGALAIAAWNVASMYFEYKLVLLVYEEVSSLQLERFANTNSAAQQESAVQPSQSAFGRLIAWAREFRDDWKVYRSQSVCCCCKQFHARSLNGGWTGLFRCTSTS